MHDRPFLFPEVCAGKPHDDDLENQKKKQAAISACFFIS
jgi:hypothetical protein